jgi:hypothetical protein
MPSKTMPALHGVEARSQAAWRLIPHLSDVNPPLEVLDTRAKPHDRTQCFVTQHLVNRHNSPCFTNTRPSPSQVRHMPAKAKGKGAVGKLGSSKDHNADAEAEDLALAPGLEAALAKHAQALTAAFEDRLAKQQALFDKADRINKRRRSSSDESSADEGGGGDIDLTRFGAGKPEEEWGEGTRHASCH